MDAPNMETVYQAISALYDNPNAAEKEKASIWLADVQKSFHSWQVADELLQRKKDVQSCYFAAQTMRSKIQHNLSELPPEAVISLRDSLIRHLEGISPDTSGAILTQLCLALADLALQTPMWQNCVRDLINSFSNKNSFALLEILTVLPQEIDSSHLKLGENRREEIKAELKSHSPIVNMFLKESVENSQSTDLVLKIIKCLTSWIQVRAINIQEVPQNAVIGLCLQILRDHNSINTLHDAASDCVCALLHCMEETSTDANVEKLLFDSVAALENSYHMAVANEDEEKAANYARVFTELAESFLEKIVASAASGEVHFAMPALELALVCVGHHDYEVAEISFNLWYRLSEEVYQRDHEPLTETFRPHVERLIAALARHCQCEPDHRRLPEEGDDFYEFRLKVTELIKDVVFVAGSGAVFRQMYGTLRGDASWELTEAALFVMQAVAKNILPDEYEYVPKVVEAILSMPESTHSAVRKTCVQLLGELSEWVERHPACLAPVLDCLVAALADPLLADAAASALQSICKACRLQCAEHTSRLLEASRAADSLPLTPAASSALMRAVAACVGRLPEDQLSVAMRSAASVQLTSLARAVASNEPPTRGGPNDPARWLDRLAALFRDAEPPPRAAAAVVPALGDAWPVLHDVMEKYQADGRIMERLCRCLRFALRCAGRHAAPLLPPLARDMAAAYQAHAHSCFLYLASILVDELSGTPDCVGDLIALLGALMPRALALLAAGGVKDHPDTVDDMFRLCTRFLQRVPLEFLSSGALEAALRCALLAARLDHRDAHSSAMRFLADLARAANAPEPRSPDKVLAGEIISTYGEELTFVLLESSVLNLHAYMLAEVAEEEVTNIAINRQVLVELVGWCRARALDWLGGALQRLPRAAAAATAPQCHHFHLHATRTTKCKEMTRLLRDFARLYR